MVRRKKPKKSQKFDFCDHVFYVNPETGCDANDGLTKKTACATIQGAIDKMPRYIKGEK
jgi:hypothetical protein